MFERWKLSSAWGEYLLTTWSSARGLERQNAISSEEAL